MTCYDLKLTEKLNGIFVFLKMHLLYDRTIENDVSQKKKKKKRVV